ncbi:nucleoid occlusion protein [Secundilactobacillus mixtipabuli]|uniref:Chromosome partitioning protein ParB n=1 Tax=Secundilactobacillus mixtipabuli TaxID=1435342 RepID=A0A1Z5I946_9LACO|nr:nucleoid occlusion protein [Secundilactobacillus mixtipabuli]GAW98188.1 chromosome partitioning protein ParB [Secundilactobacillus mixtipabuli]
MAFSLFGHDKSNQQNNESIKQKVVMVPIDAIVPNRFQPRHVFNKRSIDELAQTISDHGLLQPIVLREYEPHQYEIIAGERRFRAVKTLNWREVPAIIQSLSDDETASLALIENLQREGLTPIEEAQAYQSLMKLNKLTQSQLAENVGKSQSFIANKLRLLKLSAPVQDAIMNEEISERHGRALLAVTPKQQVQLLKRIVSDHLTVRDAERLIQRHRAKAKPKPKIKSVSADTRVAVNTIKKSLKMVTNAGLKIKTTEEDNDDSYRITIDIIKKS